MLVIEPVNIHVKHIAAVFFFFLPVKSDVECFRNSGSKFLQYQHATEGADPSNGFWEPFLAMVPLACISHSIIPHKDIHLFSVLESVGPKIR